MRVYLISYEFPPAFGGEGTYTFELFRHLLGVGIDVRVITANQGSKHRGRKLDPRISLIKIINKPGLKLYSFCQAAEKKLLRINKRDPIDIIHYTNDYCGLFLPRGLEAPFLATIHHPYAVERKICGYEAVKDGINNYIGYVLRRRSWLLEWSERRLCRSADSLIAVSRFTAQSLVNDYAIPDQKIFIIPDGVDVKKFSPNDDYDNVSSRLNLPPETAVLFVGRLDYGKGLEYLIKAFAMVLDEVPHVKLFIVGDGVLKRKLINLSKDLQAEKNILFLGKVSDEDLPKIYNMSEFLILPSLLEGLGIVLLEAMACAKPCIATNVGGIPEIVEDKKTGLLVPPADPLALYEAIYALLTDRKLSRELGENGRKKVEENYSWSIIAQQIFNVYKMFCS